MTNLLINGTCGRDPKILVQKLSWVFNAVSVNPEVYNQYYTKQNLLCWSPTWESAHLKMGYSPT